MRENLSERNSHPLRAGRQRRLVDYGRAVDYGQNGEREFRDRLHSGLETENPYLHLREFEETHQNFQNSQGYAPNVPSPRKNLEETLHSFIEKQESINNQNAQTLTDLKDTLAKFASAITIHEKGKFPSQPQPNLKGQYSLEDGSSGSQHMDQVKPIITLRNGKVVEKHILEPYDKDDELVYKGKEGVDEPTPSKEKTKFPLAPPFPHALNNKKKLNHNSEIYEMFKQEWDNEPIFWNMTLELNVFNMCKQPRDEEYESEEANMIGVIVDDHLQTRSSFDPLEIYLVNSFELSMQLDYDISNMCFLLDCSQIMENKGWKPKFEELGHIDEDKHKEVPKQELKPLPEGLNSGKDVEFEEVAKNLGKVLAEKRMHLVYGGGNLGLIGCVSKATHDGGSQILGIIPKALASCDIIGDTVGEVKIVSSMHERKAEMLDHADAFIVLPGGLGTLEELFEVTSWAQLKIHKKKPIGLLNVNGFYNSMLSFLDYSIEKGFISPLA
ncbi:hypothetical protein LWI29_007515 [Acer saccharum]|uniref:cytokinin riboside 5'-monophosphate phosphoribohydrolase n=1 Tax=Acer saccharum TaxID=4024 RepID=A0AA39VQQ8_ACESA|nr:hypothetical protein LWI29_007515 [Acer saccharum]